MAELMMFLRVVLWLTCVLVCWKFSSTAQLGINEWRAGRRSPPPYQMALGLMIVSLGIVVFQTAAILSAFGLPLGHIRPVMVFGLLMTTVGFLLKIRARFDISNARGWVYVAAIVGAGAAVTAVWWALNG